MRTLTAITDYCEGFSHNADVDFESLVNQHKDAVYRQMIRVCGNHQDAEDVLIEALFKAYRNLDQLRDAVAFRAWLARIARRICWQLRKRPADAQVERQEMKQKLAGAVASLPEAYRRVYEMRDLQNLRGDEVAKKLHISATAMKSRLHRARTLVRAQLDAALAIAGNEEAVKKKT
jgi:RNA polymerase sigma-70 factor (ECF subfamily)